jgi:transposase
MYIVNWPVHSPDLNPIENLWNIIKIHLRGKTFASNDEYWEAI